MSRGRSRAWDQGGGRAEEEGGSKRIVVEQQRKEEGTTCQSRGARSVVEQGRSWGRTGVNHEVARGSRAHDRRSEWDGVVLPR